MPAASALRSNSCCCLAGMTPRFFHPCTVLGLECPSSLAVAVKPPHLWITVSAYVMSMRDTLCAYFVNVESVYAYRVGSAYE